MAWKMLHECGTYSNLVLYTAVQRKLSMRNLKCIGRSREKIKRYFLNIIKFRS